MALKQVIDVGGQGEAPRSRDIAGSGSAYAKNTNFDPTNTDFESTNVQALGEEIDSSLNSKAGKTNLSNYILTGTKPSETLSTGTFFVDKDGALRVATTDIATTDDVGSGNSAIKSVGEILTELNSNKPIYDDFTSDPFEIVIGHATGIDIDISKTGYLPVSLSIINGTYDGNWDRITGMMIASNQYARIYVEHIPTTVVPDTRSIYLVVRVGYIKR